MFTTVATEADVRAAYLAKTGTVASSSSMPFTRQSAWSTDGQSIYHGVTGSGAGLYKFNIPNGTTEMLYSDSPVISDVAVLASSVRSFGGGTGDQILIDGNSSNGNEGGLSYVVDNGTSVSPTQIAFTGVDYRAYNERTTAGSLRGIATDSQGNVYFYDNGTGSLHKYDDQGRFSSVINRAQLLEINHTVDGARSDSGGMLRLQVREDSSGTYVTWRGDNDYVGAVRIFDSGDLNKDGAVDNADKIFFQTQYNKSMHGGVPNPLTGTGTTAEFVDYIAADLNGSGLPNGTAALPGLSNEAVTYKDLQVLSQFIDLELGDFNWNGSALDANDWSIFNSHFNIDPGVFGWDDYGWFDGDVSGAIAGVPDGFVNQLDLDYLLANQAAAVPEPGSLMAMGVALSRIRFLRASPTTSTRTARFAPLRGEGPGVRGCGSINLLFQVAAPATLLLRAGNYRPRTGGAGNACAARRAAAAGSRSARAIGNAGALAAAAGADARRPRRKDRRIWRGLLATARSLAAADGR